jgi:hypothetical protein
MFPPYEDKGKIFTEVIQKRPIEVVIQTLNQVIRGTIHIRPQERIKDEIDKMDLFLAVTNANIYDTEGRLAYHSSFMVVHRDHIIWLIPTEEIQKT